MPYKNLVRVMVRMPVWAKDLARARAMMPVWVRVKARAKNIDLNPTKKG